MIRLPALLLLIASAVPVGATAAESTLVAAASSLRHVWPELMRAYNASAPPRVTFGSSGNLLRQIRQGAPFDLLLSADRLHAEQVVAAGFNASDVVDYARGRLAWIAPTGASLASWLDMQPRPPLPQSDIRRLAIANPRFAPYGRAAMNLLQRHGMSPDAHLQNSEPQLALGENVAQALQFALSGATDGGLVALALVRQLPPTPTVSMEPVPLAEHDALIHSMVLIREHSDDALRLFQFLQSQHAGEIFRTHGFAEAGH